MIRNLTFFLCVILPQLCSAEIATTGDGQQFLLKNDGTYEAISSNNASAADYLELIEPFFERHTSEYDQHSVRFMPKFANLADKAVVGIKFTSVFKDAFGEPVFEFDGDVKERIPAGAKSDARVFYVFEDNPFIGGEPYDKLLPMIEGNTGSIATSVNKLALDGGVLLDFPEIAGAALEKVQLQNLGKDLARAALAENADPITFASPLASNLNAVSGKSLAELINGPAEFPPIEGLPESYWKDETCSTCHKWSRERLCTQAKAYLSLTMQPSLTDQHPFGGVMKRALKNWAVDGCQ